MLRANLVLGLPLISALLPLAPGQVSVARAQGPWCLGAQAVPGVACTRLEDDQTLRTPVCLYAPWKRYSQSRTSGTRYFSYSGLDSSREPLFKQNGLGDARTAAQWVNIERKAGFVKPGLFFFDTMDAASPRESGGPMEVSNLTPRITLRGRGQDWERFLARGFLYFNAEEVRLRGMRGCGVTTKLRRAGEPFHDVGIDLDHDGVVCKESGEGKCCPERPLSSEELTRCNELLTASNQRWDIELDIDCDPRLKPCDSDGPEVDAPWPPERPEWESFTRMHASLSSCSGEEGVDSRMLGRYAHEPFVQLDPASPRTVQQALRWSFARDRVPRRAGSQVTGFPWSQASAGWDCSSGGVELALNLDGGLYNEGSVVLGEGASLSGSVFARGGVRALEGATWICPVRKLGRFPDPKWVDPPDYCADVHLPP